MIGSKRWQNKRKLQTFLQQLRSKDDVTIVGSGKGEGAPEKIRKFAIEFGLNYTEYNPAFTPKSIYSAMPDSYYGKKYHFSQLIHAINLLVENVDKLVIFASSSDLMNELQLKTAYQKAIKLNKDVILIY